MLQHIDELLKNNNILECISYLRGNTQCFSLIKTLCERVENDDSINKTPAFWNDYSIAHYYLGNKEKAYQLYNKIFPYNKSPLNSESDIEFYTKNMSFSAPQIMQNNEIIPLDLLLNKKHDSICLNEKICKYIDNNYYPLNPSIIKTENEYIMNVRTVNYMFDPNFRYITNGLCNTFNYICKLDKNLNITDCNKLKYRNMPFSGNFDGWEDIRLFNFNDKLHCSFTTLQSSINRRQTICLSDLSNDIPFHIALNNHGSEKIQKNWVPIISKNENLFFIYSFYPLTILKYDANIKNVKIHQVSKVDIPNKWRGGSPALSLKELGYDKYYLCVIHESEFPKYKHKFVLLEEISEDIFKIKSETKFFYFIDGIVEFCSGLTISHDKNSFILSYGKMDRECHLMNIDTEILLSLFISTI
jgi:hypothetical protein